VRGQVCDLTAYQFDLLWVLAERAGRVLSRDQIMEAVRGKELEAFDRSIDVHMGRIRAAIEADPKAPQRILTVRAKLRLTQGLLVNGNLLQQTQMDNFNFDSGPLPLYTGVVELEETTNWDQDEDKTLVFTQVDPVPMQILFLDTELSGEQ
jgi:hypothetical protein